MSPRCRSRRRRPWRATGPRCRPTLRSGLTDPSLLGRLGSVRVPVLVVWGAADRIYPPEHGEAFAKAIPGARLVVLDEAGHLPQLEAPSALLAAVLDFAR